MMMQEYSEEDRARLGRVINHAAVSIAKAIDEAMLFGVPASKVTLVSSVEIGSYCGSLVMTCLLDTGTGVSVSTVVGGVDIR